MSLLIGIDIGTTGAKALLVDESGAVLASAFCGYQTSNPRPLWSEQDPESWWKATVVVLKTLATSSSFKGSDVKAVGLTGQMHGLVLLDEKGRPLRPCILWNDQRTAGECTAMTELIGARRLLDLTANCVYPGFTAPKILWVRKAEPEILEKARMALLPKDYIRYRLAGEFATDVSDASGTSLFDVRSRSWSTDILHALNISASMLPRAVESIAVAGTISAAVAKETGLPKGLRVVAGAGDQAAGAVGNGIVRPGVVSVTVGTSGVVFAHSEAFRAEPEGRLHAFCHAVPGAWHLMGVTLAAGGSLRWLRDVLGHEETVTATARGIDPYELITKSAESVPAGSNGLLFLPYLSGERTPYSDPNARGSFIGLTVRHSKPHIARAVLEGVAFSLKDCLDLLAAIRIPIKEVRISGGGARSPLWRQIIADVFDTELATVTSTEGAPYGAALVAGVGTGLFSSVEEACDATIVVTERTTPTGSSVSVYRELHEVYRRVYPDLKRVFDGLAAIDR